MSKLIKFSANYADEFNVYGLKVLSEDEFSQFQNGIDLYFEEEENKNEEIDIDSLTEEEREQLINEDGEYYDDGYYNNYSDPLEFSFGTNESLSFSSKRDFMSAITISSISEEQAQFLKSERLDKFGYNYPIEYMIDYYKENKYN